MYMAKRERKGSYRVFEPDMHREVVERLEMRADLQRALDTGQLEVHYQPVIRLTGSTVYGFEALLRWHHPDPRHDPADAVHPARRGHRADRPDRPLDAEPGLPPGRASCTSASRRPRPLTISVNLSVKQLQSDTIVEDVRDALATSGSTRRTLVLEITESVMMADMDLAVERLNALKALGVKLAMDDFGTGYSSLSYLSRLPGRHPQDGPLVPDVGRRRSRRCRRRSSRLGETLDLEVVAEGIEQSTQASHLRDLGCELGQGFLFAHAMGSLDLMRYLNGVQDSAEPEPRADAA